MEEGDKVDTVEVDGYTVVYGLVSNPIITACKDRNNVLELQPQCEALIKKARADTKRIDPGELVKRLKKDEYTEEDYDLELPREVAQEVHPKLLSFFYTIKDYGRPETMECPLSKCGITLSIRAYTRGFFVYIYVLCSEIKGPFNNLGVDFGGLIDE